MMALNGGEPQETINQVFAWSLLLSIPKCKQLELSNCRRRTTIVPHSKVGNFQTRKGSRWNGGRVAGVDVEGRHGREARRDGGGSERQDWVEFLVVGLRNSRVVGWRDESEKGPVGRRTASTKGKRNPVQQEYPASLRSDLSSPFLANQDAPFPLYRRSRVSPRSRRSDGWSGWWAAATGAQEANSSFRFLLPRLLDGLFDQGRYKSREGQAREEMNG